MASATGVANGEFKSQPPTMLGDLVASGVAPLHVLIALLVVLATLVALKLVIKPVGSAVLTYFEAHGRAEEVRLMLAACGVPWTDVVYADTSGAKFITTEAQMRKIMAAGVLAMDQLPLLQIDGLHLVQQSAILRYLARRHNMYGASNAEAARIDILSDSIQDWAPIQAIMRGGDNTSALHAKYLARFERALNANQDGDFLVGQKLAFVDIQLFQALEQLVASKAVELKTKWPALDAYSKRIARLPPIAAYLASARRSAFAGKGGKEAFMQTVANVLPWAMGKAEQPPLLCAEWKFSE